MAEKAAPVSSCDVDDLFRLFTLPPEEFSKQYLVLDLRDQKHYKKLHVNQAFCVRLSSNGKVLADYSGASYRVKWANDVWVRALRARCVHSPLQCMRRGGQRMHEAPCGGGTGATGAHTPAPTRMHEAGRPPRLPVQRQRREQEPPSRAVPGVQQRAHGALPQGRVLRL